MSRWNVNGALSLGALTALLIASAGCTTTQRPTVFGRIDAAKGEPLVALSEKESPALFAKAEALRAKAEDAYQKGDTATAELYGEHAIAAYEHAAATARLRAATARKGKEAERLARALERLDADEKSRIEIDREADKMEADISVRREALSPAVSGPTDPAREAARWVAVHVNLATAEALCGGAELLASKAKGLAEAKKVLSEVTSAAASGKGDAPIDASTRARAMCLRALTSARDVAVAGGGPSGDALLAELSQMGGYEPMRDERGVVATLSQLPAAGAPFDGGSKLTKLGTDKLEALGRVAKSHPTFAVLVVVHSAAGTSTAARDKERAQAAKQALAAAGADVAKIAVQTPGAQLPAYDPSDAKLKAKNERLEIVFVGGAK